MSARNDTRALMQIFGKRDISLTFDEVNTLRRAQLTLHRWAELECGDSNDYHSWMIERDEDTEIPYLLTITHYLGVTNHTRIADREAGALRRIAIICQAHGLYYYHQPDPRGCARYVDREPLPDHDYTRGIGCCV